MASGLRPGVAVGRRHELGDAPVGPVSVPRSGEDGQAAAR